CRWCACFTGRRRPSARPLPYTTLFRSSMENRAGEFVGLANFYSYFSTPALFYSGINSLYISIIVTAIVLVTAFVYGYALTRTCRSEEHTSELQSRENLVCRLLLEEKNL